jgi:hypothetical protein
LGLLLSALLRLSAGLLLCLQLLLRLDTAAILLRLLKMHALIALADAVAPARVTLCLSATAATALGIARILLAVSATV